MFLLNCTYLVEDSQKECFKSAFIIVKKDWNITSSIHLFGVNHVIQEGICNLSVQFKIDDKYFNEQKSEKIIAQFNAALNPILGFRMDYFVSILESLA